MIIEVDESFKKDFKKLKNNEIEERIIEKLNQIEQVEFIEDISNIKKMKGFTDFYRLRIWDYRLWFQFDIK